MASSPQRNPAPGKALRAFIAGNRVRVLNVAGAHASEECEVAEFVARVLDEAFFGKKTDAGG